MTTRKTRNEFSPMWIAAIAVLLFVGFIYLMAQQGSGETERPRRQSHSLTSSQQRFQSLHANKQINCPDRATLALMDDPTGFDPACLRKPWPNHPVLPNPVV